MAGPKGILLAVIFARIGWRRSAASLVVPAATFMNAILFHILPTILQRRGAPGW